MKEKTGKRSGRIFTIICVVYIALCVSVIVYCKFSDNSGYITSQELHEIKQEKAEAAMAEKIVNINTATAEQLMTLDGIGKSTAEKIIEYRENNNGFLTVDELTEVNGIGKAKLERIRQYVITGNESVS